MKNKESEMMKSECVTFKIHTLLQRESTARFVTYRIVACVQVA